MQPITDLKSLSDRSIFESLKIDEERGFICKACLAPKGVKVVH